MTEPSIREKGDRHVFAAEAVYRIAIYDTDEGYVAAEPRGTLEAVGTTPVDAVERYARGIRESAERGRGRQR